MNLISKGLVNFGSFFQSGFHISSVYIFLSDMFYYLFSDWGTHMMDMVCDEYANCNDLLTTITGPYSCSVIWPLKEKNSFRNKLFCFAFLLAI